MGLLYTKFYIDFETDQWKQISNDPIVFETIKDDVNLEITDTSHKSYTLHFKKGGRLGMFRVTGKFRLTWNNDDILSNRLG